MKLETMEQTPKEETREEKINRLEQIEAAVASGEGVPGDSELIKKLRKEVGISGEGGEDPEARRRAKLIENLEAQKALAAMRRNDQDKKN